MHLKSEFNDTCADFNVDPQRLIDLTHYILSLIINFAIYYSYC